MAQNPLGAHRGPGLLLAALLLTSCGGGGGAEAPTRPQALAPATAQGGTSSPAPGTEDVTGPAPGDGSAGLLVAEGSFPMGSDRGNIEEQPVHLVLLDAYYIDAYEVSVAQYRACVETGTCQEPLPGKDCNWEEEGQDDYPVNCVTWAQAQTYCQWAGGRLPTEAEWEKAARGADGRTYPWGEELDRNRANYKGGLGALAQVGSYPEGLSPYGAFDMAGNVWEWVADWYDPDYYLESPPRNPPGPVSGTHRVLRGGSYCFISYSMRTTHREPYDPAITDMDIGFRCARDF